MLTSSYICQPFTSRICSQSTRVTCIRTFSSRFPGSTPTQSISRPYRPLLVQRKANKYSWLSALVIVTAGIGTFKIIRYINDWIDQNSAPSQDKKEKVVIIGSGWAAQSCLSSLNLHQFDVTVISPRNYFCFTPLLADVATGFIQFDSIVQPFRNPRFRFLQATATDVDLDLKQVQCQAISESDSFMVQYDKLILALGSVSNTLNVEGVLPHTLAFRDLKDALNIRDAVVSSLERAALLNTTPTERDRLSHFIVVGGSPYAPELVAMLYKFIEFNIKHYYPSLENFKITCFNNKHHYHNYYEQTISTEMHRYFQRKHVDTLSPTHIDAVSSNNITIQVEDTVTHSNTQMILPFGTCIWAVGNSIHPLVKTLLNKIPGQNNEHALTCDSSLRVRGSPDLFAIGDCATIDQGFLMSKFHIIAEAADLNKDGNFDLQECQALVDDLALTYSEIKAIDEHEFKLFDSDGNGVLSPEEFQEFLQHMERKLTRFPQTAETASQQGNFLAMHLNKGNYDKEKLKNDPTGIVNFSYKHVGGYEYVGSHDGLVNRGSRGSSILSGIGALWMWRSIYFSTLVSSRVRLQVLFNRLCSSLFGPQTTGA